MLDLETMGTGPRSAIIAIGAVRFEGPDKILDSFYQIVDLADSMAAGLEADASTILWWMRQSDKARSALSAEGVALRYALYSFSRWVLGESTDEDQQLEMWGNGAGFDNVILANAYRQCKMKPPWHFTEDRCYRTVKNLYADLPMEFEGTPHIAVDDARHQALHLLKLESWFIPTQATTDSRV